MSDRGSVASEFSWRPTPMAALEQPEIPTEQHFVRDHFPVPAVSPETWTLEIDGHAQRLLLDLERLRALPPRSLRVVLECAGHRRVELDPVPPGVPWACGAIGEARWTGTSLGPLLRASGVPEWAREVVLEGADSGPFEAFPGTHHFARSLPTNKALDRDVVLAYEMNGEPIAVERGGPVRVIVPGWYATDSVKWLTRVWFTREEFDGVFQAHDYRLRTEGEPGPGKRMYELPINTLITSPTDGDRLAAGEVTVRGIAWGGAGGVERVLVRVDDGPWRRAALGPRRGTHARVQWGLDLKVGTGSHELACRAVDREGGFQPEAPPANVRGYATNAVHRVRVEAGTLS
ncbi:MAG TPA: sulfite oxidase [Solirubrobacteraceae bacterium]|jgi:DMSO/TMAO reductase YedYZ molybdopterin-dependent catalytic subunit